jgi:hypothetical protein
MTGSFVTRVRRYRIRHLPRQLLPIAVTEAGSTPLKRVGTVTTANVSRTNDFEVTRAKQPRKRPEGGFSKFKMNALGFLVLRRAPVGRCRALITSGSNPFTLIRDAVAALPFVSTVRLIRLRRRF